MTGYGWRAGGMFKLKLEFKRVRDRGALGTVVPTVRW